MAPSQLKQLKASLREHGVLGPQKSKKQKKATGKDAQKRLQRNAALETIREHFNPFEVKAPARKDKFEVTSGRPTKSKIGRPGVTRGLGEERRKETLLKEMQSRNKVGGMLDRRFGEDDPNMTPEQKAAERFARQNEKRIKKTSMFNLEDDSDEEMVLTHGGRSLDFGEAGRDDFEEQDIDSGSDGADFEAQDDRPRKKLRVDAESDADGMDGEDSAPPRRKSKKEVMEEVIAKSKMYKAERQAAKADDDDLRAELDRGMSDFYEALRSHKAPAKKPEPSTTASQDPHMDPSRAAMLAGKSREDAEKEYEANLRQLKMDARSKPSVRTKTDEEKAAEEAARLEELERNRIRRMKGEVDSSDDEDDRSADEAEPGPDEDIDQDDAEAFGLAAPEYAPRPVLDVEDEDEFILDDDLIESDSGADMASDQDSDDSSSDSEIEDDGDDDFINGLVLPPEHKSSVKHDTTTQKSQTKNLAFTFPCPQTHEELLEVLQDIKVDDVPTVVQRIRALYHKGLAEGNQDKLDNFTVVLTQHIAHLADTDPDVPILVLESLLRHVHSMAKSSPQAAGKAFRQHLQAIADHRPLNLTAGDLFILSGVSTIFPTSDHFHSVVTPSMLTLARYLGQKSVQNHQDLGIGAYCCSLALKYQSLAKRFVPEVVVYIVNALSILAPVPVPERDNGGMPLNVPVRLPPISLRVKPSPAEVSQKLSFKALIMNRDTENESAMSASLLNTYLRLSHQAATLWQQKSAFAELISPLIQTIAFVSHHDKYLAPSTRELLSTTLSTLKALQRSQSAARLPLLLHNHRPLAIKSSIPQFIENFNPDRHYDPDRERAELNKLKAEHKKERKGAMRELRKDANFMAREQLREKKEKDEAYEKKYKRLVAEIQGEEGRESKSYEREKAKRKGRF
ncbi:hypothetical protein PV10_07560 [Exophiala mesophila]|uniref:Nop14-like protein n=1 Tax=Exophiala mesophila TaxID=212818 RepID=A0A0D1XQ45_EXOME|nr:uncharacterized protein PV10_07560 [Exophiala mesophila]KIV90231.1 hypothetical protein PV10_07560 [Exophiala mesophila]